MKFDPINLPYQFSGHQVPGIWQYILPQEALSMKLPDERVSTCDKCPNIAAENYNEVHRCCTYHPMVPNFLVGLALGNKFSRPKIQAIHEKGYLLPEGFQRTPHQWADYITDLSEEVFGKSPRVRCPLLDKKSGLCGIYAFRNGACSTFFCRNDHGETGEKFWVAVEDLVSQMELSLQQWAMTEIGLSPKKYFQRLEKLAPRIDSIVRTDTKGWNDKTLKFLWDDWYGREFEFFEKCGKLISDNRDKLWDIANKQKISEAIKFDKAMNDLVPEEHAHEIDPEDQADDEGEDCATPKDLWKEVKRLHRRLWNLPQRLVLSERVVIKANPKDCGESRYFKKKPYMLEFLCKKGGKSVYWRDYIHAKEAEALRAFRKPKEVSPRLLRSKSLSRFKQGEGFLAEWHGRKVLERAVER